MYRPLLMIGTAMCITAFPSLLTAGSVQKFTNDKVSVTEDTLAPGESQSQPSARPGIIVYLSGGSVAVTSANGRSIKEPVKRGDTVFYPAGTKPLKNAGSSDLRFVRVEFVTDGKQETWGMAGLPPNYKILVENRYARAYDIKIAPHSYEQRHTHHDRVVVCLSGATLEHLLPNGQKQPSTLKTGEIAWRPGATHVGHNMGSTELWVICVEPK
jgi:quercetin dioxygenase-like cupin family protein